MTSRTLDIAALVREVLYQAGGCSKTALDDLARAYLVMQATLAEHQRLEERQAEIIKGLEQQATAFQSALVALAKRLFDATGNQHAMNHDDALTLLIQQRDDSKADMLRIHNDKMGHFEARIAAEQRCANLESALSLEFDRAEKERRNCEAAERENARLRQMLTPFADAWERGIGNAYLYVRSSDCEHAFKAMAPPSSKVSEEQRK